MCLTHSTLEVAIVDSTHCPHLAGQTGPPPVVISSRRPGPSCYMDEALTTATGKQLT